MKVLGPAIHYHMAIKPDGSFYTIPSVSIEGYVEMLCGKKELTDPDWEELGPVGKKPMSDYGDYRFFKVVIKKIEEN